MQRTVLVLILLLAGSLLPGCGNGRNVDGEKAAPSPLPAQQGQPAQPVLTSGRVDRYVTDTVAGRDVATFQILVKARKEALAGLTILGENSVLGIYQVQGGLGDLAGRTYEWAEPNVIRKDLRSNAGRPGDSAFQFVGARRYEAVETRTLVGVVDTNIARGNADLSDVGVVEFLGIQGGSDHGTHVTGIITADANDYAITGAVPRSRVLLLEACSEAGCPVSAVSAAITAAAYRGVGVINLSLGGWGITATEREAIKYAQSKGVIVVAAAGNDGAEASNFYPCSYSGVVCVGAVDLTGSRAYFSNYGPTVDIYAPGVGIVSTGVSAETVTMSGTSMATPFVSAAAALCMDRTSSSSEAITKLLNAHIDMSGGPVIDFSKIDKDVEPSPSIIASISSEQETSDGKIVIHIAYTAPVKDAVISVPSGKVTFTNWPFDAIWEPRGIPNGSYYVSVIASGLDGAPWTKSAIIKVHLPEKEAPTVRFKVSGKITKEGMPVPGMQVQIILEGNVVASERTTPLGQFSTKVEGWPLSTPLSVAVLNQPDTYYDVSFCVERQ